MMSELETIDGPIRLDYLHITRIMTSYWPSNRDSPAMHGAASQIINLTYDLLYYLNEKLNGSRYEVSECYNGYDLLHYLSWNVPWPLAHVLDFASFFGRWGFVQTHMPKGSNSTQEDIERVVSAAILGLGYTVEMEIKKENFMDQMKGVSDILLEYLPRSTNTIMYPYTAAINRQFGNHPKWTILLVSVSHIIFTNAVLRLYDNPEILGLCKQIIKTLMKHDARADINMLLTHEYYLSLGDQEQMSLRMIIKETLLAGVKRLVSLDPDPNIDLVNFLYDLGATDRRSFHSVDGLPLTHSQSERLSHIFSHRQLSHNLVILIDEVFFEQQSIEDAMPLESNPEAEDIVQSIESQAW